MLRSRLILVACASALALSGCSIVPRGAALHSEVLREANSSTPTFEVVPVTRANMPMVASWPRTGWENDFGWPGTSNGSNVNVIQTGDKVDIVIWDSQENSLITSATEKAAPLSGVEVGANGAVFVPYVGQVYIRGMSPDEARGKIQSELVQIAPSAQVQLSLTQGRANSVELVGGVEEPGAFPMPSRNYKVLGLIADGGGILPTLRNPRVRLIRGGTTYETSADSLLANGERNALLMPGDTVIIQQDNHSFTALGAAGSEDLVYFPKDNLSAMEAVTLMGGLQDSRADPKGVLVLREYPVRALRSDGSAPSMQQVVFTFDLTSTDGLFAAKQFRINPSDTVYATESPIPAASSVLSLVGTTFGITRQVQNLDN
ncbi:polysaccharide export protein [Citreicella sp. C3M06]|nr:polysaccharide biosynthesis/export family protein [Citreicella sp. C3M06]MBU2960681.1 polysaccharide export protein [Citreicella sp. C3M06]